MKPLNGKSIALFASYGEIASAAAKEMAAQGAKVFLSGRDLAKVEQLTDAILANNGIAEAHQVDAINESDIERFLKHIIDKTGKLDAVFNGIGIRVSEGQYGTPAALLSLKDFMRPLEIHLGSQFLTSRQAAKAMMNSQSNGTIITLTASLSRIKTPFMTGITAACTAIEGMTRSLAAEFGRAGTRVICVNPTALAHTRTIQETTAANAKTAGLPVEQFAEMMQQGYLLGKSPTTKDIGQLVAFLASDAGALLNSHVIDADFGTANVI